MTNGGFSDCGFVGCSTDGFVGDDGAIEIKSVIDSVHYNNVKRCNVDPAYKWQCIGNMKYPQKQWLDFISSCPDFPEESQLSAHRIYAKDLGNEFESMRTRFIQFKRFVIEVRETINSA